MKNNFISRTQNPVNVYFLTLPSVATIQSSTYRIKNFCKFAWGNGDFSVCDWSQFNYVSVLDFIKYEQNQGKAHTGINVSLSVLKSIALHAWQLGLISIEQYTRVKTIRSIRGERAAAGRVLDLCEINAVKQLVTSSKRSLQKRDLAIFFLGVCVGLRRKEISLLTLGDIGESITIHGKGNKVRKVHLSGFIRSIISDWLAVRVSTTNALFICIGSHKGNGLSILGVHRAIERISNKLGGERFTSHDLRRTFATSLLDNDADKFAVKRLLGHSNLNTTELYDRRGEKAARTAIALLPY